MKIQFVISIQEYPQHNFQRTLLGQSKKVPSEKLKGIKEFEGKELHYVNKSSTIKEGITISRVYPPEQMKVQEAYVPVESIDYHFVIELAEKLIALSGNGYIISDWLWNKAKGHKFKLFFKNKEITSKEEFQKTLDEFIESNKNE